MVLERTRRLRYRLSSVGGAVRTSQRAVGDHHRTLGDAAQRDVLIYGRALSTNRQSRATQARATSTTTGVDRRRWEGSHAAVGRALRQRIQHAVQWTGGDVNTIRTRPRGV